MTTTTAGVISLDYSPSLSFDASLLSGAIAFELTLAGDVTSAALSGTTPGQLVKFILRQDWQGGHSFQWPASVHSAAALDPEPFTCSVQVFVARQNGALYPLGLMSVT